MCWTNLWVSPTILWDLFNSDLRLEFQHVIGPRIHILRQLNPPFKKATSKFLQGQGSLMNPSEIWKPKGTKGLTSDDRWHRAIASDNRTRASSCRTVIRYATWLPGTASLRRSATYDSTRTFLASTDNWSTETAFPQCSIRCCQAPLC